MTSVIMLDTNMEKIIPTRIMVLVESELSSLYERLSIRSSDPKANRIAITMVPENGIAGIVMPNAIDRTAPREAPEETPRVEPSASAFFRSPCIEAPHNAREAPVSAAHITRGSLTVNIIEE